MREINFLPRRNEVWIRNVTPHFFVLWFISFKAIWKELFLKKINIYTVLIFIKVIGSKTSFQNHQPSKLHFVSGADEKRNFSQPVSHSHPLSFSHSLSLDMLNNFCLLCNSRLVMVIRPAKLPLFVSTADEMKFGWLVILKWSCGPNDFYKNESV